MFPIDIDFSRLKEVLTYDPQAPMIFSSGIFLWLFAAFMVVYVLLQRKYTARILFVTLFSYYFYYKSSGTYFFLLAIVTVADFFLAQLMDRAEGYWKRKGLVVLSLSINLGLLVYFKYTNFLGGVIASLMGGEFTALDIFLPVGISFFTFQSLSYTIDIYRRDIKPFDESFGLCFLRIFLPPVGGRTYRACPRFYPANPETSLCFAGDVRPRNLPDRIRSFQESHYLRLYQYQLCRTYF